MHNALTGLFSTSQLSSIHLPLKLLTLCFLPCSTPVMLGIYISIFIILANILFICAIYSCIKVVDLNWTLKLWLIVCCFYFVQSKNLICSFLQLFPGAMQTVSKKIVQSRTNSTLVGVFSIILVFISAFINMVRFCKSNKETDFCSGSDSLVVCGRLAAVRLRHHKLVGMCRREAEHLHGPGDAMSDLQLECVRRRGSRDLSKPRSFLPVSWGVRYSLCSRCGRFWRKTSYLHLCFLEIAGCWCVSLPSPVCISISATVCCWRCSPAPCSCKSAA